MEAMREIAVDDVVFREDLYPRFKPNPQKIQEYAESIDQLPPIEVNQRMELIDGYHRWTAHKKAQRANIQVQVTETINDFEFERLTYRRNSAHGLQLAPEEKRAYVVRHYNGKNADELAQDVSVSPRSVKRWVESIDKSLKEERDQKIRDMWLACYTQEEIAAEAGLSEGAIAEATKQLSSDLDNWQKLRILAEYKDADWSPPLYNIWSFSKKTNNVSHFGNTEARIVDNLLYLYTEPFDIVVDPFGGGGSTIDVCQHRLRRFWVSDRLPVVERQDIRKHDIKDGKPGLHKRWQDVSLLYLDPPYWRQAENQYSQDADDLANMPLEQFYEALTTFVMDCATSMHSGAHIALIIQPTQWKADNRRTVDHVFDLVQRLTGKLLAYEQRIICPYATEQYNAQQVEWAKANKQVLTLNRELIVWGVR